VGTWRLNDNRVTLELFGVIGRHDAATLEADAEQVLWYLGLRR
jgi:hypothetical protein